MVTFSANCQIDRQCQNHTTRAKQPHHFVNGYSKDLLMYGCDPGGLLVVLVICHCVNATEATMETACSVKEDGREVNGEHTVNH